MAEFVEGYIENTVIELSRIKQLKLFTKDEIETIVKRRRDCMYRIQKQNKRLTDYESLISLEISVLKLISIRRRDKTELYRFRTEIEKSIIDRLSQLHKQMCYRFQSRIDVWLKNIYFNHAVKRHLTVKRIWDRLLKVHGRTDPKLWSSAAAYRLKYGIKSSVNKLIRDLRTNRDLLVNTTFSNNMYLRSMETNPKDKIIDDIEHNNKKLLELKGTYSRESRITWDKAILTELRDARNFITRGMSSYPENSFLYLELIKLEINVYFFFRDRVLSYKLKAARHEEPKNMEVDPDSDSEPKRNGLKRKLDSSRLSQIEEAKEDAELFMQYVIEDIDAIITAEPITLLIKNSLCLFEKDFEYIENLYNLVNQFSSILTSDCVSLVSSKFLKLEELRQNVDLSVEILGSTQATKLSEFDSAIQKIKNEVLNCNMSVLEEQNNFLDKVSSVMCSVNFSSADPSRCQSAVKLLEERIRLEQLFVEKFDSSAKNRSRTTLRQLLNCLGSIKLWCQFPRFWALFTFFEYCCGDFTKLPALRWRAAKCLNNPKLTENYHEICNEEYKC